jgi:hypothetical protein
MLGRNEFNAVSEMALQITQLPQPDPPFSENLYHPEKTVYVTGDNLEWTNGNKASIQTYGLLIFFIMYAAGPQGCSFGVSVVKASGAEKMLFNNLFDEMTNVIKVHGGL